MAAKAKNTAAFLRELVNPYIQGIEYELRLMPLFRFP